MNRRIKFFNTEEMLWKDRAEKIGSPKKRDNKKLGTLSGPRIDCGKVEGMDERGKGRAVKYDSGIREIWDRDDGIRCPGPSWAPVRAQRLILSLCLFRHFGTPPPLSLPRFFLLIPPHPAPLRAPSRLFRLFLLRPFVEPYIVPSFLVGVRCPVKGSAK